MGDLSGAHLLYQGRLRAGCDLYFRAVKGEGVRAAAPKGGPDILCCSGAKVYRNDSRFVMRGEALYGGYASPHRGGKAVRERPRIREKAESLSLQTVCGKADLSYRPLPGQGSGAEYHGLPFRQLCIRAVVEQGFLRSYSDQVRGA